MLWWLGLLACGTDAPPPRWEEIERLAQLGRCSPAPPSLASIDDSLSPEEIRLRLLTWHREQPDALVTLPLNATVELTVAFGNNPGEEELPALVHFHQTLDQCGSLTFELIALAHANALCPSSPAYAGALREALRAMPLSSPRSVAAREALSAYEMAQPLAEEGWFARRQLRDIGVTYETWVLSEDLVPPPVRDIDRFTRPAVAIMTLGLDDRWSDFQSDRDALQRYLAPGAED